jgi:hypothetical protein
MSDHTTVDDPPRTLVVGLSFDQLAFRSLDQVMLPVLISLTR